MASHGVIPPRTAVDYFPLCDAISFNSCIKRGATPKTRIMQSYTSQADKLFTEAYNLKVPDYIPPFTSWYETLYQQEDLILQAREMESNARDIRKEFQDIADSGFPLPTSTLLRKAVFSVKKGKFMFSSFNGTTRTRSDFDHGKNAIFTIPI